MKITMTDSLSNVTCYIDVTPGIEVGTFANAVRIIPDTNQDFFVDFLVYSSTECRARVVGRIRVHESLLIPIRERFILTINDLENRRQSSAPPREFSIVPFPKKPEPDLET